MPVAIVTRVLDPARLLERAIDGLFPLAAPTRERPWPTLDAWLVLRQGGLRDDVHRLAASRGVAGWFDPTICLFNELGTYWGAPDARRALSEPERQALLARLLDEHGRACFGRGAVPDSWVPIVDAFIGELVGEGIAPAAFAEAVRRIAGDEHERTRAECLSAIYEAWLATLARAERVDGRDAKVRLAAAIAADADGFAARLGGRREIRIVGLADLRGGWRHLLAALATTSALDRLEVLSSVSLTLPGEWSLDASRTDAIDATGRDAIVAAPSVSLLEAPDVAREAELIAVRVRALIEQGVAPARIAVVTRQARPAVDVLSKALARVGVPVSSRRRSALAESTPARAVLALLTAARESWSRHSVAELADHPLLPTGLDAGIMNLVGYSRAITSRAGWRDALDELLARSEAREREPVEPDARRAPLPRADAVRAAIAAWEALQPELAPLDGAHTLARWCDWVRDRMQHVALAAGPQPPDDLAHELIAAEESRARDAIIDIVEAWRDAMEAFGAPSSMMEAGRFLDRLALMLAQDVITPPVTDFGVVVAEALAAGWRAFDHVFIVGMSAGEFPRRPVGGQLLDAHDRQALIDAGLPLDAPDAWRERERELFRVLGAAPRSSLTLSWPAMDAEGREVARSAFIDEVAADVAKARGITDEEGDPLDAALLAAGVFVRIEAQQVLSPGFPVVVDAPALDHAREVAMREVAREADPHHESGPWNGRIEDRALVAGLAARYDESYQWSATQLEQAAKCRWHWFASRQLRLEAVGDAEDQLEPTVSGSIRHEALARFFARAADERGAPVQLMSGDEEWARDGISRALDEAWDAARASGLWLGPPLLRPIARDELLRELRTYLRFEIRYNEDGVQKPRTNAAKIIRSGAVQGEYPFTDVPLEGGGVRFRLRGSVDRIDEGLDDRVEGANRYLAAIDYKSSIHSTPAAGRAKGWADGIVLQVPLYAAALEQRFPEHRIARMEYRTLRGPKVVHQLCLHGVGTEGKGAQKESVIVESPEARAMLDSALEHAGALIATIRRAELPAQPAASSGCPPFCPALDICRIPGGPRNAE